MAAKHATSACSRDCSPDWRRLQGTGDPGGSPSKAPPRSRTSTCLAGLAGALVTLAGVVTLGVMEGILVGVVFALVLLLRALAFPVGAVLGRTPDGRWHDTGYRADAVPVPGLLVYHFAAPLFFANCNQVRDRIEALIAAALPPRVSTREATVAMTPSALA